MHSGAQPVRDPSIPDETPTLFINGKFTAQRMTGVQRYADNLVRALDERADDTGSRPCVLLCPPAGRLPSLRRIRVRHTGLPGLPLHLWEQACLPWAARSGLLLSLAGSAPLVARRQCCTFHDAAVFDHPEAYTPLFGAWYRRHFRWLARRAERVLTVSAHSRARLSARLQVPTAAIGIVPNGSEHLTSTPADATVLDRLQLRGRRFALAVGSANPLKNLAALLQAWQRLPDDDDLRLVVVGGSDAAVFADGAAARQAPDGRIVHAGVLDDASLKALYQAATLLVFPSLDEGFGLPPLEAMALGCPVVAARAGALPEVCGDAAVYVDPSDGAAIAEAVMRVAGDAELRRQLAAAGRQRAAAFTWPRAAAALLAQLPPAEAARR